ncbi:Hypothetical predicted protein [Pelobates cultripes]|uniref:Cupin-like domain-containing protein n=1 Tax=Pelobates cultripes TaxID=61616 RepID=A0AAD1TMI6_PELCU|nr:Hypothetical predicted protein [Pelobates cultripes]
MAGTVHSLWKCLEDFSEESRELQGTDFIPYLETPPMPLQFYREWLCPNRPCIIRNSITHWPALLKWTTDYLRYLS